METQEEVVSATGQLVKKGTVTKERVPEIRYEEVTLKTQIGSGCFGKVYAGTCRGSEVAIKVLSKQELDPKMMEEFRREVDIMTQMRAPNVILFMGACTEPGKMLIVTELMKNSVHDLLRKKVPLTLLQRIKMARDAVAGMCWLHGANPQILHRDLKPQNLLVDEHLNVKLCDFGLSQVKLPETKIKDGKSIPGTPLWMAPEVLLGKEVDEKCDIYSFGLVLWETITGEEPFKDVASIAAFKRAILTSQRPPIPSDLHPRLAKLIELCWHQDPLQRPAFKDILPVLDSIIIKIALEDKHAAKFWKKYFFGKIYVPWNQFERSFASHFKVPVHTESSPNQGILCLKKILALPNKGLHEEDSHMVTLEKFGHVVNWFGPFKTKQKSLSILDKIRGLMQQDWFHGDLSKETAEDLLAVQPKGTFLVRTSITKTDTPAPFTITKVSKKGDINHQRIHRRPDGTFEVSIKTSSKVKERVSKDDNLVPFIKDLQSDLYLINPCPGSRYKSIFVQTHATGYL